jgi:NAD+ kinase
MPGADRHRGVPSRIALVVHPSRNISGPLRAVLDWAEAHGVAVVQATVPGRRREVAPPGDVLDGDLIVSIGGDGTMLAAIRAALSEDRPVLGVACGSLGVLTNVGPDAVPTALSRVAEGDWVPRRMPALHVAGDDGRGVLAVNDVAIVRTGIGQIRVTARIDGTLFCRLAGDGCVVSTPLGSGAYSLAAGGALLMPDVQGYQFTRLSAHGGSSPPLVLGPQSVLGLDVDPGFGGARLEVDGQITEIDPRTLRVSFRPAVATLVGFAEQEPFLTGLRRRQIIIDSARILADEGASDP